MNAASAIEPFGTTAAGEAVGRVTLRGGGLTANVMTWGAAIQDLRLDGHEPPLVLGFPDFASYPLHSPFFGQTPGRFANRIANGRFSLDGTTYQLECNEGANHLHGGSDGTAVRVWTIEDLTADSVRLTIADPDGHAGYPGTCTIACTYTLKDDGILSIVYESRTDRPTICNIAHHGYFNLDGSPTILDHDLRIDADAYLPTDAGQIPTGTVAPVSDTPMDFTRLRPIRMDLDGKQVLYDHNYCLAPARREKQTVVTAQSPRSGVRLAVRTGEPGLQFYGGYKVRESVPGLAGAPYGPWSGFCLETQTWPDAPNHEGFPDATLKPGQILRQETDYIFTRA